ncbi:MAG: hypothetical protein J0651_02020, partial [Actinobacteria bacterium]|nr:hypothetical protein [Actinomycetota bacterium]
MYYFVCSSEACVKQAFRTSWEPRAMGSMSSTMVRKESSLIAFALSGPSGHLLNRRGVAIGGRRKLPIQRHWHLNNATVPGTAFGYAYHLDHIVRVIRLFLNAGQAIVDSATFGATATEIHVDPITANPHRALWMS